MLPPIGSGTFTPAPLAPTSTVRAVQGAAPGAEAGAAQIRPETAVRVDPPRAVLKSFPIPEEARGRADDLMPPDPEAPAGPPPAFDASPLERERERALDTRPPVNSADAPRDPAGREPAGERRAEDTAERASADLAEVRRMSAPEAERTLDVTR